MTKPTTVKCRVCGQKAVGCFSPDLDIQGLCFCKKHKEDVMSEYIKIISLNRYKCNYKEIK